MGIFHTYNSNKVVEIIPTIWLEPQNQGVIHMKKQLVYTATLGILLGAAAPSFAAETLAKNDGKLNGATTVTLDSTQGAVKASGANSVRENIAVTRKEDGSASAKAQANAASRVKVSLSGPAKVSMDQ